jgi:hypothetical protein
LQSQTHLSQTVLAGRGTGLRLHPGKGREQQRSQNADDGDYHKQLDQGEAFLNAAIPLHIGLDRP